ncbi:potassium channel family protein [Microbulbifer hydrolyticus]|uniref:Two pore domain potassium channel family protein n=1 Tax=Microbulbifer hydrolyticus TaxID=48074 RepID=A0A6P1TEH0_9GAMM|nr:potassium channel family protein [Microbulbifer hydrolyticus]MBB5211962.1 voltage-gated potassium channel Kch [Microbulbifer hydrolyticus]QHQ39649.1 two pore domain potassium channel family protein [Microbulbifer hydrolyticus]
MVSFLINIFKLLKAVVVGIKDDQEFRILLFLLVTMLIGSTFFYSGIEGWSKVDALYFSVMTMSTIGYGDLVPTTEYSKIFTIIFTFLSVGIFVSLNTKIVLMTLNQKKEMLLKRKIKMDSDSAK